MGRRRGGFGWGGHALAGSSGARGREKRRLLNSVSGVMVIAAGAAGAFFGYAVLGVVGATVGGVLCAGLMTKFVTGERLFR